MLRTLLYTILIMAFLGLLLTFGLFAPDQGKIVVRKIVGFISWKSPKPSEGLLGETEESIKKFNESYRKVQALRHMTLTRSGQTFKDLDEIYKQTRENLSQLLLGMDQLSVTERKELFDKFTVLHNQRAKLVEAIIHDQLIMINLNEQMDQELQAISRWLIEKSDDPVAPTTQDVVRMKQYENLRANLTAFNEHTSRLDSMRLLFTKKSKESVGRLAETNRELENHFRELLAQVELSTPEQSLGLWKEYQRLEAEQRELVDHLRSNEEFISANQGQVIAGVSSISKSIEYRTDTQLQRFRDNFILMESRRRELLKNMNQKQQAFMDSQPTMQQMMQDSRYRMEAMREQARQISSQYEQMEQFRKSNSSMIRSMTSEIKDTNEFASQKIEEVMEKSRDQMQSFMLQMDSAQRNVDDFIKTSAQTKLADHGSVSQLKNLQEKSRTLMDNLKKDQDQMRSLNDQASRDQQAIKEMKKDAHKINAELMKSARERTKDQQRIMSERVDDQMQRIKDAQMDRKWNLK